jgi:hypothetical protein
MSIIIIEIPDENSNQSNKIGIGPSRSLVAFLSGGVVYTRGSNLGLNTTIPIAEILNTEECDYVFPVDKTEFYDEDFANELESSSNLNHSEDKNVNKLQAIFIKLEEFYAKSFEDSVKSTLWDYTYIKEIIAVLENCKNTNPEVKYYCDCEDDL